MAISEPGGNGAIPSPNGQCKLLQVYLQDASFEAPGVPGILFGHDQPALEFNVANDYTLSADASATLGEVYAVNVRITVTATAGDKTLFLVEVQQGGLFAVSGYSPEQKDLALRTLAPEAIYPYARELVSSLVSRAGFPRLQLKPFDFESGFRRGLREHQDALNSS